MVKGKRPAPRYTLATNLKALLERFGMSGPTLAHKAGIDRKSVNNMLNARYDPQPDKVEAVAQVFQLTSWQLFRPIKPQDVPNVPEMSELERLLDLYAAADDEQRRTILNVAELAGRKKS